MELDHDPGVVLQSLLAGGEQATVRLEAVAGGEHRGSRLLGQVGIRTGVGCREIGQVRDHDVDRAGHWIEKVTPANADSIVDSVDASVLAGESDGDGARVGRKELDLRRRLGDGDRDRPCSGAYVDHAGRPGADAVERCGDQLFARRPRRHDTTASGGEGKPVEADLEHF
jgi:hypothetical protein